MKFQNNRIPKYTKSLITSEHTSFLLSIALRYYVLIKKQLQLLITSQHSSTIELFPSISLVFNKENFRRFNCNHQSIRLINSHLFINSKVFIHTTIHKLEDHIRTNSIHSTRELIFILIINIHLLSIFLCQENE